MKKLLTTLILLAILSMIFTVTSADSLTRPPATYWESSASYTDANGNGLCEIGETIFFFGDEYYGKRLVDTWFWDFDSDGNADATERVAAHVWNELGVYTVTLNEIDGGTISVELTIDIVATPDYIIDLLEEVKTEINELPRETFKFPWFVWWQKYGLCNTIDIVISRVASLDRYEWAISHLNYLKFKLSRNIIYSIDLVCKVDAIMGMLNPLI